MMKTYLVLLMVAAANAIQRRLSSQGVGMLIYVQTTDGARVPVEVSSSDTVQDIITKTGKRGDHRIKYHGEQLLPTDLVWETGICAEAVVEMIPCTFPVSEIWKHFDEFKEDNKCSIQFQGLEWSHQDRLANKDDLDESNIYGVSFKSSLQVSPNIHRFKVRVEGKKNNIYIGGKNSRITCMIMYGTSPFSAGGIHPRHIDFSKATFTIIDAEYEKECQMWRRHSDGQATEPATPFRKAKVVFVIGMLMLIMIFVYARMPTSCAIPVIM